MIPVIDLSSNNGPIDWLALAPWLLKQHPDAAVIIKVSQGDWYVNELLDQQRDGAHAHGIKHVGLYHFFEAVASGGKNEGKPLSGAANADFFMASIGAHGGILTREFPCIDWESEYMIARTADLRAAQTDLIGRLSRPLGVKVVEYSGDYYIHGHNLAIPTANYWCAAPGSVTAPSCLIWQYDWHGRVPGCSAEVDLNYLVGGIETLQPFQWGLQPDPVAGKPAVGTPDVDGDVLTIIKGAKADLEKSPPDVLTAIANLDRAVTKFGLVG